MGDRAVIGFKANANAVPVFLYMHWGGEERYVDAQRAISAAQPRWSDGEYATRIGISHIIGQSWAQETGFGISAGHNSFCTPDWHDVILISWKDQTVEIVSSEDSTKVLETFSFESFGMISDPALLGL